jgi:hypothetical protein
MKILAGLFATCLVAMPVYAQGDPAPGVDAGKPAEGSQPPADDAASAGKPADSATPEPQEAPEGATPDKPAAPAPER